MAVTALSCVLLSGQEEEAQPTSRPPSPRPGEVGGAEGEAGPACLSLLFLNAVQGIRGAEGIRRAEGICRIEGTCRAHVKIT